MSTDVRSRMFEPFFTTKFTGRGMGLAVVQGIVRSHGGKLSVESEPGRGTVVSVWLPALTETATETLW
jgi:signal transduction histidine kinase